ncbi:universal stress protein [Lentibacillus saliphilus]|uniref:universal stress protein n=1 Tax=Lentibacillus saliphilus TaxID=2737028 RepID=UPI001C2F73A1|nr:universal stress protein [Lentibacillus saliphilus]
MYQKILLASDGSEHALRAADHAFSLASLQKDAQVDIIYVVDTKHAKEDVIHHWGEDTSVLRKQRMSMFEQKAQYHNVPYELTFLHGEPGPTIVKHANHHDYDIVVIGSRGLNVLQEMVLGSVSHKVAKRVNCPVLIIK